MLVVVADASRAVVKDAMVIAALAIDNKMKSSFDSAVNCSYSDTSL